MYPQHYFGLFPAFPREDSVFVAMSFDDAFTNRWTNVIKRGIERVRINNIALNATRVDQRQISDSILTDILSGIGNSRLVVADISSIGYLGRKRRPIRNANVMYELGLAHSVRLPEEVIVLRSDRDRLDFDLANLRVIHYDPDGAPEEATKLVSNLVLSSLQEVEKKHQLAVKSAASQLDEVAWMVLAHAAAKGGICRMQTTSIGQILSNQDQNNAILRLLQLGALVTAYPRINDEMLNRLDDKLSTLVKYTATPFGVAILHCAAEQLGFGDPALQPLVEKFLAEKSIDPKTS